MSVQSLVLHYAGQPMVEIELEDSAGRRESDADTLVDIVTQTNCKDNCRQRRTQWQ
jgi:hypothetical protein